MIQWLQLAGPERHAGDGLGDPLVAMLEQLATADDHIDVADVEGSPRPFGRPGTAPATG